MMEIFFIWKMQLIQKSKSTIFMVNLSLADIFLGLTICTTKVTDTFDDHMVSKVSSFFKHSLIQVSLLVSILTNLVLTSERLLLVKSPIRYKQFSRRHRVWICLGMWVAVMLVCFGFYHADNTFEKQFVVISSIVFLSLPWPVISFTLIKKTINDGLSKKHQTTDPNTNNSNDNNNNSNEITTSNNNNNNSNDTIDNNNRNGTSQQYNSNERKFMSLCFRTFIVFAVCWTPFSVYGYLVFFGVVGGDPIRAGDEYWTAVQYTVHVIAFMNSTINPITYLFTYDFLSKICKPCKPKNRIPRTKATSE